MSETYNNINGQTGGRLGGDGVDVPPSADDAMAATMIRQIGRLRLQRRISAVLGLAALMVGYGLAVTFALSLF